MSYYLLPKVNNEIVVDPRYEILNPLESLSYSPRLSHSLIFNVKEGACQDVTLRCNIYFTM